MQIAPTHTHTQAHQEGRTSVDRISANLSWSPAGNDLWHIFLMLHWLTDI